MNNIASVGVEVKFSLRGLLAGLIFTIVGLALLGRSPVIGATPAG